MFSFNSYLSLSQRLSLLFICLQSSSLLLIAFSSSYLFPISQNRNRRKYSTHSHTHIPTWVFIIQHPLHWGTDLHGWVCVCVLEMEKETERESGGMGQGKYSHSLLHRNLSQWLLCLIYQQWPCQRRHRPVHPLSHSKNFFSSLLQSWAPVMSMPAGKTTKKLEYRR